MHINDIKILVARLGAIVEGWDEQSGAPAVERHIAASLLAELYEAVKFDTMLAATEVTKEVEEQAPIEESIEASQSEAQVAEVIDLSDIFGGSFDDEAEEIEKVEEPVEEIILDQEPKEVAAHEVEAEPEETVSVEEQLVEPEEEPMVAEEPAPIEEEAPVIEEKLAPVVEEDVPAVEEVATHVAEEEVAAVEEESQPAVEEKKAPEVEEEKVTLKQASLFDMEVVRRPRSSNGRRVIMSLYGESTPAPQTESAEKVATVEAPAAPTSMPIEEPAPEPEPTAEEKLLTEIRDLLKNK